VGPHGKYHHQGTKGTKQRRGFRLQVSGFRAMRNAECEMRSGLRVRVGGLTMKGMKDMKYESFYHSQLARTRAPEDDENGLRPEQG
jgi:hypothetical protein